MATMQGQKSGRASRPRGPLVNRGCHDRTLPGVLSMMAEGIDFHNFFRND